MRTFIICVIVVVLACAGYAYFRNPDGCKKIVDDFGDLYHSLTATKLESGIAVQTPSPVPASAPASSPIQVAPSAQSPAPVSAATPPPLVPLPPSPLRKWTPPGIIPQKLNWTWNCGAGTFDNVIITDVKADTVSITHSHGAATLSIALVPEEVQKDLNYDRDLVAAIHTEKLRETDHPYYLLSSLAEAQRVARQLHWPLVWMDLHVGVQNLANPAPNSEADLTQMAINHLKSQAVIILLDGNDELPKISPILRDRQFFQMDDGPLPGGHHFNPPKIVFSDASVLKAFGRVSATQMAASREAAIDAVFQTIARDPSDQYLLNNQPAETGPPPK